VDRVISKQTIAEAVEVLKKSEGFRGDVTATTTYVPRRGDDIDEKVGEVVNRTLLQQSHTRIKRLPHSGAYVVYHRVTGKRSIVHVRVVRTTLMIRVGGGWDGFESWLARHTVEVGDPL
jgi:hypothetical protein